MHIREKKRQKSDKSGQNKKDQSNESKSKEQIPDKAAEIQPIATEGDLTKSKSNATEIEVTPDKAAGIQPIATEGDLTKSKSIVTQSEDTVDKSNFVICKGEVATVAVTAAEVVEASSDSLRLPPSSIISSGLHHQNHNQCSNSKLVGHSMFKPVGKYLCYILLESFSYALYILRVD